MVTPSKGKASFHRGTNGDGRPWLSDGVTLNPLAA